MVSGYLTIFTLNSHDPCGHPAHSRLFAPFLRVPKKRWNPRNLARITSDGCPNVKQIEGYRISILAPNLVSKSSELELDFLHHQQSGFRIKWPPYINLTKQADEALLAFQLGSYGPRIRNQSWRLATGSLRESVLVGILVWNQHGTCNLGYVSKLFGERSF